MALPRLASLAAALLLGTPAGAGGESTGGLSLAMPRDVSTEGWRTDWLINITIVFVAILFAIMVGWLLLACLRYRAKHEAVYDKGDSRLSVFLTIGTALAVFFCVDGNLFVNSTKDLHDVLWNFKAAAARPDAVRIEINAHQWAWEARYAGADGKFNTPDDILTTNDVRVPVGSPVVIQLAATDVLHSLYIPNLRVKQDAIPGSITRAWFQAKETGEFDIACAQHCGVGHYKMCGKLTILQPRAFEQWSVQASKNALQAYDETDAEAHGGWEWKEM
jgi:cytochrome c oxidase subunit 2